MYILFTQIFLILRKKQKSSSSWAIIPYSPLIINRRFRGTLLPLFSGLKEQETSMKQVASTKMQVICPSKTSVDFQLTIYRYIPKLELLTTTAVTSPAVQCSLYLIWPIVHLTNYFTTLCLKTQNNRRLTIIIKRRSS